MCLMHEIVPITQLPWFREVGMYLGSRLKHGRQTPESRLCAVAAHVVMTAWDIEAGGSLSMEVVDPTWRPQFSTSQTRAE